MIFNLGEVPERTGFVQDIFKKPTGFIRLKIGVAICAFEKVKITKP